MFTPPQEYNLGWCSSGIVALYMSIHMGYNTINSIKNLINDCKERIKKRKDKGELKVKI